ncbi:hypothetical protein LA080_003988 [Diaporthe eres]|nr:hypothetical protein LA080_003988 [Diaporthe eres]
MFTRVSRKEQTEAEHGGVFGELIDGANPDKGGLSVNFSWLKQFVVKPAYLSERNVRGALITDCSIWAWRISELRSTMAMRKDRATVQRLTIFQIAKLTLVDAKSLTDGA